MVDGVSADVGELISSHWVMSRDISNHLPFQPVRYPSLNRNVTPRERPISHKRLAQFAGIASNLNKTNNDRRVQRSRHKDDDHSNAVLTLLENPKAWLAYRVVGGLRADPFNSLPVEPRDCIPNAVDHYIQVFIPERVIQPFSTVPGINDLAKDYFQLCIADLCLFEATIAMSQASYVSQQAIRRPTKEVLHHHGKALALLQDKLASPTECTSETTIHCILSIMSTHFFFGELDAHQAHLDGLWALIRRRGGIQTLGWKGTLAQAVETVTSFRSYIAQVESPAATPEDAGQSVDYPHHPFSTELCESIAKLPEGFGEIALKRKLSLQTIDLIADIQSKIKVYDDRLHPSVKASTPRKHIYEADKCVELLKASGMDELERMLCAGLLAYIVQSHSAVSTHSQLPSHNPTPSPFPSRKPSPFLQSQSQTPALTMTQTPGSYDSRTSTSPLPVTPDTTIARTTVYDDQLRTLVSELAHYTFFTFDHEVLIWITYTFATILPYVMHNRRDFFDHTLLRFRQSNKWENLEKILRKFLWTENRLVEWRDAWDEARRVHQPQLRTEQSFPQHDLSITVKADDDDLGMEERMEVEMMNEKTAAYAGLGVTNVRKQHQRHF